VPTTRCKRFDCEYHGIEVCMIENNVNAECVCTTYKPRQPVHITPSDLRAPFNPQCHKSKAGKYVSDGPGKVLK
jgi:hypothetical protein